ncbi:MULTISPECIES: hypothetical protein [unclassified Streptomyces]|uniref:hypothetical protein n=1 Tax=unclassified Streptomyces TaxID=2593676 RepID=UPI0022568E2B|nr:MULTISPECIES: hypothetical protein [unclassified Streptomyces]MCX4405979.1 hypothetical protein [Streptomyces sp. NBC_01764]MCX5189497.1 hypothetical protein [Streptomyces sp. NBC_00268]
MAEEQPAAEQDDSSDGPAVWHQPLPWAPSEEGPAPTESAPGKPSEARGPDEAAPAEALPETVAAVAEPGTKRGRPAEPPAPEETNSPEQETPRATKWMGTVAALASVRARLKPGSAAQPAPSAAEAGAEAAHGTRLLSGRLFERKAPDTVSTGSASEPAGAPQRFLRMRTPQAAGAVLLGTMLLGAPFVLTSVNAGDASPEKHTAGAEPVSPPPEANVPAGPEGLPPVQPSASVRIFDGDIKSAHPKPESRPRSDLAHDADASAAPSAKPHPASGQRMLAGASRAREARAASRGTTLYVHHDEQLFPGQSWHTNRITLTMQKDGNFVIYDKHRHGLWSTRTNGVGYRAIMQADGNFVIYDRSSRGIWSTGTAGHDGAFLSLQNDGNVTVRYRGRTLWASGTRA